MSKEFPFEIRDVPGKGVGLFATRDIAVGELIIAEKPLFTASSPSSIVEAVKRLNDVDKIRFMSLRDQHSPDSPNPFSIFKTNALPLGCGSPKGGIFPVCSRINSSCLPNVHHYWNPALGKETIRAVTLVGTGQEILTTYLDFHGSRARRQEQFRTRFGFECTCKFCTGPHDPASDIRRAKIGALDDTIAQVTLSNPVLGYSLAKERLRLLDAEGLADQSEKGRTHYDAFQPCVFGSDFTTAKRHVALAYGSSVVAEGVDGENAIKFGTYYRAPKRHPAAGMGRSRKMPMICDTCGCVAKITCEGCRSAVHCDNECQKEHAKWHEPICQAIQQFGKK